MTTDIAELFDNYLPYFMLCLFSAVYVLRRKNAVLKKVDYFFYLYWMMLPYWSRNQYDLYNKVPVLAGLAYIIIKESRNSTIRFRLNWNEWVFLLAILLSGINALDQPSYLVGVFNFSFIITVSFYVFNYIRINGGIRFIYASIAVNTTLLSIMIIIEYMFSDIPRPSVTYSNPNYLGHYIMLGIIVILYERQTKVWRAVLVLSIAGLLITQSAACIGGVVLALMFYFAQTLVSSAALRRWGLRIGVPIFLTFMVLSIAYDSAIRDIMASTGLDTMKADTVRYSIWKVAAQAFIAHPLIGIGYNTFSDVFPSYATPEILMSASSAYFRYERIEGSGWVTHNDFLRVMAELGAFGLAVFLIYLAKVFRAVERIRSYSKPMTVYWLVASSLIFSITHNNMNSAIFWLVLALPTVQSMAQNPAKKSYGHKTSRIHSHHTAVSGRIMASNNQRS